jgi:hypothetical protein
VTRSSHRLGPAPEAFRTFALYRRPSLIVDRPTTWDITVGKMPPGIYRVDVVLNDKTAWRDFLRVTD